MELDKKIAALDIGSNSVMMLLISYNRHGKIKILDEFGGITKLGDRLKRSNSLSDRAMKRTLELCDEIVQIAYSEGAEKIIVTTSSIIRKAVNKTEFFVACHSQFNIFPQVLNPTEEANFLFSGAIHDFEDIEGDIIVLEVGGDMANIMFGTKNMMVGQHSLDLGYMRLTKQFTLKQNIFSKITSPLKRHIKTNSVETIQEIKSWLGKRKPTIICCGGTATTLASIYSNHSYRDRDRINKTICPIKKAGKIAKKLKKISIDDRKALLGLEHKRAEFIHTSIYTMYILLKQISPKGEFHITTNGLRTGILKKYIKKSHSII